jgi:hypothetical protein
MSRPCPFKGLPFGHAAAANEAASPSDGKRELQAHSSEIAGSSIYGYGADAEFVRERMRA